MKRTTAPAFAGWGFRTCTYVRRPVIVAALREVPDMLGFSDAHVVRRIIQRFGCGRSVAYAAVAEVRGHA